MVFHYHVTMLTTVIFSFLPLIAVSTVCDGRLFEAGESSLELEDSSSHLGAPFPSGSVCCLTLSLVLGAIQPSPGPFKQGKKSGKNPKGYV